MRGFDLPTQGFGNLAHLFARLHLAQDREFLSAQTRDKGLVGRRLLECLRNVAEGLVARIVAISVVDALEPVHVDKKQGKLRTVGAGLRKARLALADETAAVCKTRQVIGIGELVKTEMELQVTALYPYRVGK